MIALAFAVAVSSLAVGLVVAYGLRAVPTVRVQLAALALVSVCPLVAVLAPGVMFHTGADRKNFAVAAGSATAAAGAGLLFARSISQSLRRVADASSRFASGDLAARAPTGGPSELAELAASFNWWPEASKDLRRSS